MAEHTIDMHAPLQLGRAYDGVTPPASPAPPKDFEVVHGSQTTPDPQQTIKMNAALARQVRPHCMCSPVRSPPNSHKLTQTHTNAYVLCLHRRRLFMTWSSSLAEVVEEAAARCSLF